MSCCMHPDNKPEERRKETPRVPNNKDSGVWADVFEYCLAACRTHGRSTSHENAYIGPRHHCFSKLGKPMVSLRCVWAWGGCFESGLNARSGPI